MGDHWLTRMALGQLALIFTVTVGGTLGVFVVIEALRWRARRRATRAAELARARARYIARPPSTSMVRPSK